ncbi:M24 family metallopeptidase [Yoonia sp. R2331]|uniref:M24 family metallopeptidase n=1 Tax=Yoonia sp. R2331 TaxID=3237238 RepID=UPI0034E47F92
MNGLDREEFVDRTRRAQNAMAERGFAGLLLTTEPDVRYFTGFLTRFWESPTRPWFVIVPAAGDPVAVIPAIGAALMARGWIDDIRTWRAPDLADDGVNLLIATLQELCPGPVAIPMGHETHLRMPIADFEKLRGTCEIVADARLMRGLRLIKSEAEIDLIRLACQVANRAFDRVPEIARAGVSLAEVFRHFQILCLQEGADWVPYLAGGAGPDGYDDVISPATEAPLRAGDVLMLDTGLVRQGYFCDFDRNFSVGPTSELAAGAHSKLIDATAAAMDIARPGITTAELFHAMDKVLTGGAGGSDAGRFGHGLGMQLTEAPSLIPGDHTVLQPGMVLTLEPGIATRDGRMLVHEENIVIRDAQAEYLSRPAERRMTEL